MEWTQSLAGARTLKEAFLSGRAPAASSGRPVAQVTGPRCQATALPAPGLPMAWPTSSPSPPATPTACLPGWICQKLRTSVHLGVTSSSWSTPPGAHPPPPALPSGADQPPCCQKRVNNWVFPQQNGLPHLVREIQELPWAHFTEEVKPRRGPDRADTSPALHPPPPDSGAPWVLLPRSQCGSPVWCHHGSAGSVSSGSRRCP